MFFFGLLIFLICGWFLPWWALAFAALAFGLAFPRQSKRSISGAAAIAWAALAFIQDGRSHGLISQRMSGLFSMPSPALIFVLMALIGGVTALLFFATGRSLRSRFART